MPELLFGMKKNIRDWGRRKNILSSNNTFYATLRIYQYENVWETCTFSEEIVSGDLKLHKFAEEIHEFRADIPTRYRIVSSFIS